MIRLLLCDLDGTLVEPWRTTPLPDVRERLRVLQDQGVPVVVVTNQREFRISKGCLLGQNWVTVLVAETPQRPLMSLEDLFCDVDDFCRRFLPVWHRQQLQYQERQRLRGCRLALSEIMTILIHFHQSHYRTFKAYYLLYVCRHLAEAFPNRLSYNRLVAVIPAALVPLCVYLLSLKGLVTGIALIDATSLVVCHNRRLQSHKVFQSVARRGKTSVGWFYGFKLHLVVNDR